MVEERIINRNSDLFAIFIAETLLCSMIGAFLDIPLLSVLITAILVVALFINNHGCIFIGNKYSIVIVFCIIMVLYISSLKNGFVNVMPYAMYFCCFGITAYFFSSVIFCSERVIQTLVKIYSIYIVMYILFLRNMLWSSEDYWSEQMGIAYGFVPIIILALLLFIYPQLLNAQKNNKLLVLLMGGLALMFVLIDTGTRGAIVVVFIGAACVVLTKLTSWKKILLITILASIVILCFLYYKEIILFVAEILSSIGIRIGAINKMVHMINQGTEFNGRDALWSVLLEYFVKSPVLGHGVGFFEREQGTYPHNFVLQLLCEYGIVGMLFGGVFFLKRLARLFFSARADIRYIELFLFLSSVPMLFFSNTYWQLPLFWCFFFVNEKNNGSLANKYSNCI